MRLMGTLTYNGNILLSLGVSQVRSVNGKLGTKYGFADVRDYDALSKWVDTQMINANEPSTPTRLKQPATGPPVNPSGISVPLTSLNFSKSISLVPSKSAISGWFVKFYVPWCSHCQHMADAWSELAREMKGKLNIAEVNCDEEAKICNDVKLRGYPSLIFFKGGERVEYDGLRGIGDLVTFAHKASQYEILLCPNLICRAGVHEIIASEFDIYEKKEEVIFLYFYDSATTSEDFVRYFLYQTDNTGSG